MASIEVEEANQSKPNKFRVFLIPLMSPGHMIPMIDMANLFSHHGASATIVTTTGNESLARTAIDRSSSSSSSSNIINLLLLPFPSSAAQFLPDGKENLTLMSKPEQAAFFNAFFALQKPLEDLLRLHEPDCIVSDSLYTWTSDFALALGVPRLVFHGHGVFPLCVHESIEFNYNDDRDDANFLVRGLPGPPIEMKRSEVSAIFNWPDMIGQLRAAEEKSYGVVVNSCFELEPAYAELYRQSRPSRRAWYVGPVSPCNSYSVAKKDDDFCLKWLDSVPDTGSVVYVCFGSLNEFGVDQLREIAFGLEDSGHFFIWVVRDYNSSWLDEEFEDRVKGKGVVVRGWAPQTAILDHPAVGGFVTHCGWNSTVEGISAGVALATWPVEYEQFVNEKLVVEVLRVGVRVERGEGGVVRRDAVAKAVKELMGGGVQAEERRKKVKEYAAMAKAAMEEGGSSYADMASLIRGMEELKLARAVS